MELWQKHITHTTNYFALDEESGTVRAKDQGMAVVGGMIARNLAKYNANICILEKENDVAMGATRANSAIVHAGFDAKEGSLKARLNVRGSEMMEGVARELGVSQAVLSHYENGKREPSLNTLVLMSKYFNVSINYLITGKEFEKR